MYSSTPVFEACCSVSCFWFLTHLEGLGLGKPSLAESRAKSVMEKNNYLPLQMTKEVYKKMDIVLTVQLILHEH